MTAPQRPLPQPPPKPRRLIIRGVTGEQMLTDDFGKPLAHYQIDLTGVANANCRAAPVGAIQEQCNLGCWHDIDKVELPLWGTH